MFTYDDMQKLIAVSDNRDKLIQEINKLSERDIRTALICAMLSWRKGNDINNELLKRAYEENLLL